MTMLSYQIKFVFLQLILFRHVDNQVSLFLGFKFNKSKNITVFDYNFGNHFKAKSLEKFLKFNLCLVSWAFIFKILDVKLIVIFWRVYLFSIFMRVVRIIVNVMVIKFSIFFFDILSESTSTCFFPSSVWIIIILLLWRWPSVYSFDDLS